MTRILILSALLVAVCLTTDAQSSRRRALMVKRVVAAAATCDAELGGVAWCESFDNAFTLTWTDSGTVTSSFQSGGRTGTSGSHFLRVGPMGSNSKYNSLGVQTSLYVDVWVRVSTDSLSSSSEVDVIRIGETTPGGSESISLVLMKTAGGQLQFRIDYYDNGGASGTAQNITANTWYHVGLHVQNGSPDIVEWFLSTTDTLGAAIDSINPATSTRSPQYLDIGFEYNSGTWGSSSTVVDFDSLAVDDDAFAPNPF